MKINKTKLKQLSIAELWALLQNAEADYQRFESENQRLKNDEDAQEKSLQLWANMMTFSFEFQERIRQVGK